MLSDGLGKVLLTFTLIFAAFFSLRYFNTAMAAETDVSLSSNVSCIDGDAHIKGENGFIPLLTPDGQPIICAASSPVFCIGGKAFIRAESPRFLPLLTPEGGSIICGKPMEKEVS